MHDYYSKNGIKISIQPILKSNYTSFMFNYIFCEMNIKKVIHRVGAILISSWKCILQYLLGYQSILLGYPSNIHSFMPSIGSWYVIIHVSIIHIYINCSPEKSCFRSLQSLLLPQFSPYRHQPGFTVKRKQVRITNYRGIPINW